MRKHVKRSVPFLICALAFLLLSPAADAAVLKGIQNGTTTIAAGATTTTVAIATVDLTKSFLIFTINGTAGDPANIQVSGQLTAANQITFARIGTTGTINIKWNVAEFISGFTVYRGSANVAPASVNNVTVCAACLNTSRSFPLISYKKDGTSFISDDLIRARITSTSNLELTVGAVSPNTSIIEWQVVQFDVGTATMQTNALSVPPAITFAAGDLSKTAAITSIDTGKSWLIYTYDVSVGGGGSSGDRLVRGLINSATQLQFDRGATGPGLELTWYLVTFTDGTVVPNGNVNLPAAGGTSLQKDTALPALPFSPSIACTLPQLGGDYQRGGKTSYTTDDNPSVGWATAEMTSSTNLRVTRGLTGSSPADFGYFVPEFTPPSPVPSMAITLAGPATTTGTATYTISYSVSGTGYIQNAALQLPLPAGATFSSCTGGCTTAGSNVNWSLGTLSTGASGSVTVTVSFSSNATFTFTANESYTVCLTAFTGTSNTVSTIKQARPTSVVSGTATICNGSSTTIQAVLTGSAPWNVTWSDGVVQSGVPSSPATRSVSPGVTTTYTVANLTDANATALMTDRTGSAIVTVNPLPTVFNVTGGGAYCSGGAGVAVGLSGSQSGVNYQLYRGGVAVGSAVAGTGAAIGFGNQTTAGTYTVVATNAGTGCASNMSGSATVTINPLPTVFNVTGGGTYCSGGAGVAVGLSGSQSGVNYQLYRGGVAVGSAVAGTGAAIGFGNQTTAGTYTVVATNAGTGCSSNMTGSATVTINPLPTVFNVTGGGAYCSGGAGVAVGLSGSQAGVNYQLYRNGGATAVGSPVAGTGAAISFGNQTTADTYTVVATNAGTGCASNMSGSATVTINPLPTIFNVTGGGAYCSGGAGVAVGLSGSQAGVNYQLYRNGGATAVGSPVAGTGAAISFGNQTTADTYTVVATNAGTGCTSSMTGSATVTINPLPTVFNVTGGAAYCSGGAGVAVGLSGSQSGVNYQLYRGGVAVGSAVAGTGAAIGFGNQTTAGTYTVVATNAGTGCASNMSGSATVTINPLPTVFNVTGGGAYCSGGAGVALGLSGSQAGVNYQLYRNGGATAVGSPVAGTGAAISFGNQTTADTYTVVATNAGTGCASNMSGSATVTINPLPTIFNVTGGGAYCSGGAGIAVGLSGSQSGVNYQLYRNGGATAVGSPVAGTGSAISFGNQITADTYTVVATNGTGCTSSMTGNATVTINPLPTIFNVTGGGAYCSGGAGVAVGLSGSQAGVNYQLYRNGGTTAVGSPVAGTGAAISFGNQTTADTYTVVATNGTGCTSSMTGNAAVTINPLPTVFNVTGGGVYCSGGSGIAIGLNGSQVGVNYQLYRNGGATAVGSPVAGTGAAISFGNQTTADTYTVVATNAGTGCVSNMNGNAVLVSNVAPVAVNNSYSTSEDTPFTIAATGVLSNDTDTENNSLTAILVSGPSHGTLTLNSDGSFTYTPGADYNGGDSFTYKANDGCSDSNIATVNITITAVNDAPVAVNDSYSIAEDGSLSVPALTGVLSNDTDVDSGSLSAILVSGPSHGTLTLNSNGSFSYIPDPNYNGPDSFTYKANDGSLDSNIATVNINVTAVNDAPVAVNDSYSTAEDGSLSVPALTGVLSNDTDLDSGSLSAILVSGPSHGTLTLNADGSFTYTPDPNYNGPDSFTYKANDGSLDSNIATVNINVTAVNDTPVAVNDSYSTAEDGSLSVPALTGLLSNDTDVDSGSLSAILVSGPSHGTLTLNADGSFTYTPDPNYNGPDSFTYKANDGSLDSNIATVNINVTAVNDAPAAVNDSYSTAEDGSLTVPALTGVLSNDTDLDSGSLSAILVSGPSHGTLTLNADGSFTYTPDPNYNGPDSFTYKANDGSLDSNIATVNINVTAVNDAPVAVNDSYSTAEDGSLSVPAPTGVLANDTDLDSGALSAILVSGPSHGTLTLNADGSFTYTPDPNYNGPDSFTYKANDGSTDSNIATVNITINAINDAPIAVDDSYSTTEDGSLNVASLTGVLANDTDVEGDSLSAILVSSPLHGTLTLNPDGSFNYTPDADYNGPDSFTYKANDGSSDSNIATVNITVNGVNDAPLLLTNLGLIVNEGIPGTITNTRLQVTDTDNVPSELIFTVQTATAAGTLKRSGIALTAGDTFTQADIDAALVTYLHSAGQSGTDSFIFTVSDGSGGTIGAQTFSILVIPIISGTLTGCDSTILSTLTGYSSYQWYLDDNPIGGATTNNYTATTSGSYTVHVTGPGGLDATSAPAVVTINPTPSAPTLATPVSGSTTSNHTPVISGTAVPGSTVTIYIDNVPVGTAPADGSGNYTFVPGSALSDGVHTVYATATVSGCPSAPSAINTFTIYSVALLRFGGITQCEPQVPDNSAIFQAGPPSLVPSRDLDVPNFVSGASFPEEVSDLQPSSPCLIYYEMEAVGGNTLRLEKIGAQIVITY